MADQVRKVNYCYVTVPNRAGQGSRVLDSIQDANVNLLAYSGFPAGRGSAQLDFVAEKLAPIQKLAKKNGWSLSKPKKGFLVQGRDEIGAVARHFRKLAREKISITAADAVCAGKGRYGMILWVKPRDYARAGRALGAR